MKKMFLMCAFLSAYIWYKGQDLEALYRAYASGAAVDPNQIVAGLGLMGVILACALASEKLSKDAKVVLAILTPILGVAMAAWAAG